MYINRKYGRTGTLWEGRYKSSLVDADGYLFACCRYIELNPVRAAMVNHPSAYVWSSFAANAQGSDDVLISPHPLYLRLGANEKARQAAYQDMFKAHIDDDLANIRASWQTGTPLGNDRFREQIESVIGRKVGQSRRGRPTKVSVDSTLKGSDPL